MTNNPEYEENVKNRIIIINENMFTKFKKNFSDNSYELNEEILKIFTVNFYLIFLEKGNFEERFCNYNQT